MLRFLNGRCSEEGPAQPGTQLVPFADLLVELPLELGEDGYPVQYRGASTTPGLYFVGLPFLHSFASMLIGGAGRDTERVAEQIVAAGKPRQVLVWNGAVDAVG